ncbi:hypothetical protein BSPWISOXPB_448 [uncultured Gammaproteobacteria bacterium]|nr:hypothetical protein BSPWISOXPB_448 [uncultured Gammaproteobacteria bacterium]
MWQVTGFVQIDYNSEMIKRLPNMSRIYKQLMMMSLDSMLLVVTLLMAFSVRLGEWYFPKSDLELVLAILVHRRWLFLFLFTSGCIEV